MLDFNTEWTLWFDNLDTVVYPGVKVVNDDMEDVAIVRENLEVAPYLAAAVELASMLKEILAAIDYIGDTAAIDIDAICGGELDAAKELLTKLETKEKQLFAAKELLLKLLECRDKGDAKKAEEVKMSLRTLGWRNN